jgi:isoleucyl-tRNA synthetase
VVHQAPAFGEVDYDVLLAEQARFAEGQGPELICAVGPDGKFTDEAGDYRGRWVKEADRDLSRQLRAEGMLFHQEQYLHDYPFCWRAEDDPLIQYPRKSWFVRTTQFKDRMLQNNRKINWLPEHIRDGRFGNFLEANVDWALSRERYWGTPLPIWVCEDTGHMEAVANYDELLAKPGVEGTEVWEEAKKANPDLADDLRIHKPYIDAVTYESPKAPGKRMRRVSEVIDCWYDSGAMPFAQWGYPHQEGSQERFAGQFPADFISEAIDQTRGWFYSQLAISTLLFSEDGSNGEDTRAVDYPHPFANCIVLGLMLAEWWESKDGKERFLSETEARKGLGKGNSAHKIGKMSKSLRNYRSPDEIFDTYGADALRWYFFANQAPWTSIIYSEQAIKECIPGFLLRLWNVFGFFTIYAQIDKFDPAAEIGGAARQLSAEVLGGAKSYRPVAERGELDQWILSELNQTIAAVTEAMDAYDNFAACGRLNQFVDALSNWYVRRSRDRFWGNETSDDKVDGYWTLYECLTTTTKLIAPFVPFLAEKMWQDLAVSQFGARVTESVHLCDYPASDAETMDEALSVQMALVREVVSLGRSARMGAKLKVRQPLAQVEIVLADQTHRPWLESHAALIRQELNVKAVEFIEKADQYISYTILPDLKRLGPKLGKQVPIVRKHLAGADGAALLAELEANGKVAIQLADGTVELDADDIQVRLQAKEGWAAAQGSACVVVLATELTDDLVTEGHAREIVHSIQNRRKDMNCEYTDRIAVGLVTESAELLKAVEDFGDYITKETLIAPGRLGTEAIAGVEGVELKLAGHAVNLYLKVVDTK